MTAVRRFNLWFNAVFAALNVGLLVSGSGLWINAVAATVNTGFFAFYARKYRNERKRHGEHRGAEEGPHDPGTGQDAEGTTGAYATGGAISSSSGLILGGGNYRLTFGGSFASTAVQPEPKPDVEHVTSDIPILAHRIAKLRLDGKGKPFVPLHHGEPFGREAVASCGQDFIYRALSSRIIYGGPGAPASTHKAPGLGCTCGFYSLPPDVEPWDDGVGYVTLQVELSGTVIEHERGYRASHQYVLQAEMAPCRYCAAPSAVALFDNGEFVAATCLAHLEPGRVAVSFADLAHVLGVPVVPAPSVESSPGEENEG